MFRDNTVASDTAEPAASASSTRRRTPAPSLDHSAVSEACRGFERLIMNRGRRRDCNATPPAAAAGPPVVTAVHVAKSNTLRLGIAESLHQIEAANHLIRRRYAWRGYDLDAIEYHGLVARSDDWHREITFFAAEPQTTLGTITLRLDGPEGLSAEATHSETMQSARTDGRRLGELTRLAVAGGADSRQVLASLFGLVYAVGRMVHDVTDVFIEVNPRHVAFYSRTLGFAAVGDEKFCERVRAPSVLLHLDVEILDGQLGFANLCAADEPAMRYGT
jgi:hypothetical protein